MKSSTILLTILACVTATMHAWAQTSEELDTDTEPEPSSETDTAGVSLKSVDELISEAEQIFAFEPTLEELSLAALKHADADRESTMSWLCAPNRSALLPRFKFVAEYDFERDESLDRTQLAPDRWGADTDRDFAFLFSAQWELNELVYSPEEVKVYRALADRADRREAILSLLIGYYFERRRLILIAMLSPPKDTASLIEIHVRIAELTASIDSLTGGLLSRTLEQRRKSSPQKR